MINVWKEVNRRDLMQVLVSVVDTYVADCRKVGLHFRMLAMWEEKGPCLQVKFVPAEELGEPRYG